MLSFSCAYWLLSIFWRNVNLNPLLIFKLSSYCWALRVYIYIYIYSTYKSLLRCDLQIFSLSLWVFFSLYFFESKMCLLGWFPIHLVSAYFLKNIYLFIYWLCWCGLSLVAVRRLLIAVSSLAAKHGLSGACRLNPKSQRCILLGFFS